MQPRGRLGALVVTAAAVLLLGSASTALATTSGAEAKSAARPADLIPDASWHGRPIRRPDRTRIAMHEPAGSIVIKQGAGLAQPGGSSAVREVQRRLLALGYRTGPADGAFGPRTRSSVAWFQIKHRLPATGVVDGATFAVLRFRTHAAPVTTASPAPAVAAGPPAPRTGRASHPVRTTHPATASRRPAATVAGATRRHADHASGRISTLLTLIALVFALLVVAAIAQWVRLRPRIPGRAQLRAGLQKPVRLAAGLVPTRRPHSSSQPARARARAAAGRRGRSVGTVAAKPAVAGNGARRAPNGNGHRAAPNGNGYHGPSNGNGRRVIGYALGRSAAELARQAQAIERLCGERAWSLAAIVKEPDKAARTQRRRPGLSHVLKQVAAGGVGKLVVARLHSLADSPAELAVVLEWCRRRNVGLVALDVGLDTTTADGRIAARCLGAVAAPPARAASPAAGAR